MDISRENLEERTREQAAHWLMRLTSDEMTESERQEFERWLLADARHASEFTAQSSIWHALDDLEPETRTRQIASVTQSHWRIPRWLERKSVTRLAAAVLVAAVLAGGWFAVGTRGMFPDSYVTRTGETRAVALEDGSVAYLNTRTTIRWEGNAQDRRVVLERGEALFDVAHDPSRPFRVIVDDSEIRVLGTRFNVYRKDGGDVILTVLEGSVAVQDRVSDTDQPNWLRELTANQQIVFRPIGVVRDVHHANALAATRWRDGVLVLENEPLPNVLDELTRYTDQRILIRDPRLQQIRVGGVITIRDVEVALAGLEALVPVAVTRNGDTFSLDYRVEDAAAETPRGEREAR